MENPQEGVGVELLEVDLLEDGQLVVLLFAGSGYLVSGMSLYQPQPWQLKGAYCLVSVLV